MLLLLPSAPCGAPHLYRVVHEADELADCSADGGSRLCAPLFVQRRATRVEEAVQQRAEQHMQQPLQQQPRHRCERRARQCIQLLAQLQGGTAASAMKSARSCMALPLPLRGCTTSHCNSCSSTQAPPPPTARTHAQDGDARLLGRHVARVQALEHLWPHISQVRVHQLLRHALHPAAHAHKRVHGGASLVLLPLARQACVSGLARSRRWATRWCSLQLPAPLRQPCWPPGARFCWRQAATASTCACGVRQLMCCVRQALLDCLGIAQCSAPVSQCLLARQLGEAGGATRGRPSQRRARALPLQ